MGINTALENGATVKVSGLFANALVAMYQDGWWKGRTDSPFEVNADEQWIITDTFSLTKGDMLHVTTLMFQKLFPNLSWKRTWKRKAGHEAWLTTEQMVRLVVIDPRFNTISSAVVSGHVITTDLLEFCFFRRMADDLHDFGAAQTIMAWVKWVFITCELMRELDCAHSPASYNFG